MKKSKSRLVVINDGKLLVLKTKKISDRYTFIGGSIGANETPLDALKREALEEANLALRKEELKLLFTSCSFYKGLEVCNYFFTTNQPNLQPELMEFHKFSEASWVAIENAMPFLKTRDEAIVNRLLFER